MAPRERGRRNDKASQTIRKAKGKAKGKGKKGKETRVCHECNKPGQLRKDCTVCKKRLAEKTDTTTAVQGAIAAVQGAMVETWEYTEDDYVFAFGETVIAAIQGPETHICIDSGASRSACLIGYKPDDVSERRSTAIVFFRLMYVQLRSVGTRKCIGRNVIRLVRRNVLVPRWSSRVCCFLL